MNVFVATLKVIDPLVIVLTGLLSYWVRFGDLDLSAYYQNAILVVFALTVVVFQVLGVYRWRPAEGLRRGLGDLLAGWFGIVITLVLVLYAAQTGSYVSRQWLGVWWMLATVSLLGARAIALFVLRSLYRRGLLSTRIAIAGAGELGRKIARRFAQNPELGIRVVAFYDDAPQLSGEIVEDVPVRGTLDQVVTGLRRDETDQVWLALPLHASSRVAPLLAELLSQNVRVRFVPDIFGFQLLNHSFTEICGFPVVNISESPHSGLKGALKWLEDKTIALLVLAVVWPLLVVIAIAIRMESRGPVLFRQRRSGLDNRAIVVWKFRTMKADAEETFGDVPQARRDDPRVTRVGAFLRRTSLDELPQFINVLKGDMSVVGPRPHPLWLDNFHRDKSPRYVLRSWIKPGITGWAQVCGWRGETDELWKMDMRVQHDLYYIENWSLGFDIYILLMTLFRLSDPQAY